MVDTIFADVAQPDQARIVAINAHNFLKNGGHFVISIKVSKVLCTYSKIQVCSKIPPPKIPASIPKLNQAQANSPLLSGSIPEMAKSYYSNLLLGVPNFPKKFYF